MSWRFVLAQAFNAFRDRNAMAVAALSASYQFIEWNGVIYIALPDGDTLETQITSADMY